MKRVHENMFNCKHIHSEYRISKQYQHYIMFMLKLEPVMVRGTCPAPFPELDQVKDIFSCTYIVHFQHGIYWDSMTNWKKQPLKNQTLGLLGKMPPEYPSSRGLLALRLPRWCISMCITKESDIPRLKHMHFSNLIARYGLKWLNILVRFIVNSFSGILIFCFIVN